MKLFRNKTFLTISGIVLAVALIVSAVAVFGFVLPQQRRQDEQERLVRAYRDAKMEQYRQENEKYADYEVDVAFLGDSLTDGYDLAQYYPQYVTANRGIGGDTTFDLERRLQVSVYDLKPKVAVMLSASYSPNTDRSLPTIIILARLPRLLSAAILVAGM